MKRIIIRDMNEEDIPSVALIERISFSIPWSETSFYNEIYKSRSIPHVAVLEDRVIGYLCLEQVLDEGHILDLAIHPDYRGMGIATALVEKGVGQLKGRGCRLLFLEVRASNRVAKRFYEGHGFRIIGTRKKYYLAPTEDAVIMMLGMQDQQ
jgi:ribosomal-protein-alanine N-acetyltransferase